jgi:ketosteroid isomerase-like protein
MTNKEFVTRFFQAMNEGDVDTLVNSYADDGEVHTKGRTLMSGIYNKEQISQFAGGVYDAFPEGISFEVLNLTAEDNRVAVEARSRGMHVSGQEYTNEYHFLFVLEGGRIKRLTEYMDTERMTDVLCGGQRPA